MSAIDFNDAEPQREGGPIPAGTISLAIMRFKSGGYGEGGFFARSKAGEDMLDVEFTLYGGPYERRKVWMYMSFSEKAVDITKSNLRAALESARGIVSTDKSAVAVEGRKIASYGDFDGLPVCIKIGIEKGTNGYADKNCIWAFVTPDKPGYISPTGAPQPVQGFTTAGAAAQAVVAKAAQNGAGSAKPNWA
jgi:hypothetical protein